MRELIWLVLIGVILIGVILIWLVLIGAILVRFVLIWLVLVRLVLVRLVLIGVVMSPIGKGIGLERESTNDRDRKAQSSHAL